MTILTIAISVTAYLIAVVMEKYVKKYHPEVWEELNRWED